VTFGLQSEAEQWSKGQRNVSDIAAMEELVNKVISSAKIVRSCPSAQELYLEFDDGPFFSFAVSAVLRAEGVLCRSTSGEPVPLRSISL
jgi:hypothetical protein